MIQILKLLFSTLFLLLGLSLSGQSLEKIELLDIAKSKEISAQTILQGKKTVIVFFDIECPYVNSYADRLKVFSQKVEASGFQMLFVYPSQMKLTSEKGRNEILSKIRQMQWSGKVVGDIDNDLVQLMDATKLPELFIVEMKEDALKYLYKGAIDDNPQNQDWVKENYANDALKAIKANKKVKNKQLLAMGCRIKKF